MAINMATQAPTMQRASHRVAFAISASTPGCTPFCRHVSQAYLQSATNLTRDVYIRAPSEFGLPEDSVLKVIKPLYGIPEAGLHWYLTYMDHHKHQLGMNKSYIDPCMLILKGTDGIKGPVILQFED